MTPDAHPADRGAPGPRGSLARTLATTLTLVSVALATASAAGETIEIAARGKSPYAIVVPDQADQKRVLPAAELLQEVVQKAAGAKLPIVKESELRQGTPAIYLGKSRAARKARLPVDEVQGWAYLNRTVGRDIFLVGDDGLYAVKSRRPVEHLGTLKAVTTFLEEQVGVRFVMPGEKGLCVPRLDRIDVDARMNASWKPRFDFVTGANTTLRGMRDKAYAAANNLFGSNPVMRSYGAHSYYTAVPAKVHGKTHPEYFALLGGVRTPKGNHLCISNPAVQELMLREMERGLDSGYSWTELGQTDGYQACQCKACVAVHPDPGERTWIVHRKLAKALRRRRPGKKVVILSYPPTQRPPRSFDRFPDNVLIEMCRYSPEAFAAWAPFDVGKTVYTYNWGAYHSEGLSPKRTPRAVVAQVRLFVKNKVRAIKVDGGFNRAGQGCHGWALEAPTYYAYGKALGNPNRDPDTLLREYVDAAFGTAAAPMRAFFKAMHDRLELYSRKPSGLRVFVTPEDFFCHFFPPRLLNDMATNLERAKAVADDDDVRARLELVEIELGYVKRQAAVLQFFRAYRLAPSWETFDLLAAKVLARRQYVDWLYPDGPRAFSRRIPGLPRPFANVKKAVIAAGGRVMLAPLNWDFDLLREKKVLPGVGAKRVECPRAGRIVLDGKMDEPVWRVGRFEELSEIGMGALKNASRFKLAYDDRHIYFGVVCESGDLKRIGALKSVGRDGPASGCECAEIMLDAFGTRERYCHFILNPMPNSTLDRRFGYIDDPVHPLYNRFDMAWNGVWDYVAAVDRDRKRWTAEVRIPYATLGADAPTRGTVWTVNVGRTEWPRTAGGRKGHPTYSLWSPNLESRTFHDLATFGDLVFK